MIDWEAVSVLLDSLYSASKGEPAWPPLAMFKALLLSIWYDLSDVKLADRASLLWIFGNGGDTQRTAFVRLRRELVAHELDRLLFTAVTAQLTSKAVTVKTGTLVDATIITSASEDDGGARWVKHNGKAAVHGFKAHVGADADTALAEQVSVTSASIVMAEQAPQRLRERR